MTDTDTDKSTGADPALGKALEALTPRTPDRAADPGPWHHQDKTWKDGPAGGTPITAADLNQMGDELSALFAATPQYTVADWGDPVPSTPCTVRIVDHAGVYQGTWYDGGAGRIQVGWPYQLASYVVSPFGFVRDMGTVSVRAFWTPLGVDVPLDDQGALLGTLPEWFRPLDTETGLILDSNFGTIGALVVTPDGQVRVRHGANPIAAGTRITLASFAYHAA